LFGIEPKHESRLPLVELFPKSRFRAPGIVSAPGYGFGVAVLVLAIGGACQEPSRLSPVVPSDGSVDPRLAADVASKWSPYVGVHIDAGALDAYRDALSALRRAGRLSGLRVEINRTNQSAGDRTIAELGGLGVDLLALIGNEYLFDQNIEHEIDDILAAYPGIRYFQIGNEVTTILPKTGPTMDIEQYMAVFQRVYKHVQRRHPRRAVLVTQSTLGSGLYGPGELEVMAKLGLADMDPEKVIIAVNSYDPESASQYRGILGGTLRRFRVWVTESGVPDPSLHISFVREKYPLLRDYFRAERVYWYTMWGGDSGSQSDFSLIRNPMSYPNYWKSPLFELLVQ
jgi:hypothetical protein